MPAGPLLENSNTNLNKKAMWTAIYIVCLTSILFWAFYKLFIQIENRTSVVSVSWKNENSISLSTGPNWFFYDTEVDSLKVSRQIDELDKGKLISLCDTSLDVKRSYLIAVDKLSFISNSNSSTSYFIILVMTAICGAIGVQLRTINNFIGVACFKNDFNFDIWWPWYFLRPLMGAIIGPIIFVIFDGKLMPMAAKFDSSNTIIIAVSVLAGFGSEDVLNTLRNLSKRLFGYKSNPE